VKINIIINKALIFLVLFFSFSLFSQNAFKVKIDNIKEGDSIFIIVQKFSSVSKDQQPNISINVEDLSKGVYILRVSFNENSSDLKFIKK
jgi:hypothetical protein